MNIRLRVKEQEGKTRARVEVIIDRIYVGSLALQQEQVAEFKSIIEERDADAVSPADPVR